MNTNNVNNRVSPIITPNKYGATLHWSRSPEPYVLRVNMDHRAFGPQSVPASTAVFLPMVPWNGETAEFPFPIGGVISPAVALWAGIVNYSNAAAKARITVYPDVGLGQPQKIEWSADPGVAAFLVYWAEWWPVAPGLTIRSEAVAGNFAGGLGEYGHGRVELPVLPWPNGPPPTGDKVAPSIVATLDFSDGSSTTFTATALTQITGGMSRVNPLPGEFSDVCEIWNTNDLPRGTLLPNADGLATCIHAPPGYWGGISMLDTDFPLSMPSMMVQTQDLVVLDTAKAYATRVRVP